MIGKVFGRLLTTNLLKPRLLRSVTQFHSINFTFCTQNQNSSNSHPDFQTKIKPPVVTRSTEDVHKEIEQIVKGNKIVLFMKGVPSNPMCGYSNYVCEVLKFYSNNNPKCFDQFIKRYILKDSQMREEVKKYSNWPTFPQLYVEGNLVGGSDILTEMHKDGSLKEMFSKIK